MDDAQIIRLYEMRIPEAIAETEAAYGDLCRSIAGKVLLCREDVDECVNDTYLALWNAIPPAKPSPLGAYITMVVRNQAWKRLEFAAAGKRNAEAAHTFAELDGCIPDALQPEQILEEKQLREAIIRFLQTRRKDSRIIFLRRYFFFDSVREIAQRYSISESKVKSSLLRTRNQLRLYLIKEGYFL